MIIKKGYIIGFAFVTCFFCACELTTESDMEKQVGVEDQTFSFFRGADLSYVNEMKTCGATYYDLQGVEKDPVQIFAEAGTNLVRLRLWHNPDWTDYSNLEDVKKAIAQAKAQKMQVLLDFHYSDDWADPHKQKIPAAWLPVVKKTSVLGDSVYNYTYRVLEQLYEEALLPELVQVGNEINIEILQDPQNENKGPINWGRNAFLLKKGMKAVRDASDTFGQDIALMLHVAQPENALWWFEQASENGITDFDWIGISYYPKWSTYPLQDLASAVKQLTVTYAKKLMVVETAYPFTLDDNDAAGNILGKEAAIPGYNISPDGQLAYLEALESKIIEGGGQGLVYWEPAWISTGCSTLWGIGSHWDNATLFDHDGQANKAMSYYKRE